MSILDTLTFMQKFLHLPHDFMTELHHFALSLLDNTSGMLLFTHMKDEISCGKNEALESFKKWDVLTRSKESSADMFIALLLIVCAGDTYKLYRTEHIDEQIFIDTFADIGLWAQDYFEKNGQWGISEKDWLCNHLTGSLFAIGRLQYMSTKPVLPYTCIMSSDKKQTVLLVNEPLSCSCDGFFTNNTHPVDSITSFTVAPVVQKKNSIDVPCFCGNPVLNGVISPAVYQFPVSLWNTCLPFNGSHTFLDIHIPAGKKLDIDECLNSFDHAYEFFKTYKLEKNIGGFICQSWLLDPLMLLHIDTSSNIARFASLFAVCPPKVIDYKQGVQRVFHTDIFENNSSNTAYTTGLQKTLARHLSSGGIFRQGCGIRLT